MRGGGGGRRWGVCLFVIEPLAIKTSDHVPANQHGSLASRRDSGALDSSVGQTDRWTGVASDHHRPQVLLLLRRGAKTDRLTLDVLWLSRPVLFPFFNSG